MEIDKKILEEAAATGSVEAARAFSKLSGQEVKSSASFAELISYKTIVESIKGNDQQSVITYAQLIEGMAGVSLLVISREQTLALVDLLNNREVGSTGVLLDFDRSAVKETLNILSNAYLTSLAKLAKIELLLGSPYMLPASSLESLFAKLESKEAGFGSEALVFRTNLEIKSHEIKSSLFLVFSQKFVDIIKQAK